MRVFVVNGKFAAECTFFENDRMMQVPRREFKKKFKLWAIAPTFDNAMHLKTHFKPDELDDEAKALVVSIIVAAAPKRVEGEVPPEALEGLLPHQTNALRRAWNEPSFAILHRPRLRKTATTIRLASARFLAGQIDKLVIFAPNSIKAVWRAEFEKRAVCPYDLHLYESDKKKAFSRWLEARGINNSAPVAYGLSVLVLGIEGMSSAGAAEAVEEFLRGTKPRNMAVVDESTRIANHKSNRTKALWEVGDELATFKNILTGSEITRAIENLFAQFRFMGVHTLVFDSFYAWRNRYCLMGGFERKKIVGIKNGDELMARVTKYADLVKTTDVVPMPEKTFVQRMVKPSPEQVDIIKSIQKQLFAEFEGREISISHAMVAQLRAQQVAGGHFPAESETEEGVTDMIPLKANPKMDELMSILSEEPGKVVIWARFVPEIEAIVAALSKEFGPESVVSFYGAVEVQERFVRTRRFQTEDEVRYMVANPQAAGMGQEMSAADVMIWYSQDFNYESRIQALERCTNLDKLVGIGVVDLVLDVQADRDIQYANDQKKDLADYVEEAIHSGRFSLV
ncbi:DNA helicase [Burkholderia phage Bm1]